MDAPSDIVEAKLIRRQAVYRNRFSPVPAGNYRCVVMIYIVFLNQIGIAALKVCIVAGNLIPVVEYRNCIRSCCVFPFSLGKKPVAICAAIPAHGVFV